MHRFESCALKFTHMRVFNVRLNRSTTAALVSLFETKWCINLSLSNVSHIDQQWQADLADMQGLSSENGGNNYILTCIDVLSGFAWAVPVRSKSTRNMVVAFKELFQIARPRVPQHGYKPITERSFSIGMSASYLVTSLYTTLLRIVIPMQLWLNGSIGR
jgi:hypothetical protein